MKGNEEYAKKLQQLYRSLKRRYPKAGKVFYDEPLEAVVYAIVSEDTSAAAAQSAVKRFGDHFADLNDLRVSRADEIVEVMGSDTPAARSAASAVTTALRAVFDEYHTVSLKALKKMGKRQARKMLEQIEGVSDFAVDYCVLTALQGHAVPLTKKMIDYLRSNELVHPQADEQEIGGFLARQVRAENTYEFYALLRRASESDRIKAKTGKETARKTTTGDKKKKTKVKTKKKG